MTSFFPSRAPCRPRPAARRGTGLALRPIPYPAGRSNAPPVLASARDPDRRMIHPTRACRADLLFRSRRCARAWSWLLLSMFSSDPPHHLVFEEVADSRSNVAVGFIATIGGYVFSM